jgi:NAD(P)H-hydrate epimerase
VAETEARTIAHEALPGLLALVEGKSAVAIGPGLSINPSTQRLVRELLPLLKVPVVLDADGLNALAGEGETLRAMGAPVILTPHPGELSRLLGIPRDEVLRRRIPLTQEIAGRFKVTLMLKMARTIIAFPTGDAVVVPTGNPGMASGGTGDVLTGILAGLLGQGVAPDLSAQAGAFLHGLAGDLAAERLGQEAMLAGDLLEELPAAIRRVKGHAST